MGEERDFDLGDILSITTGMLVCPIIGERKYPIDGVYDILNWMTGESLYTHQLPRVCREAKPVLLARHPQLAAIAEPNFGGPDQVGAWLAVQKTKYGDRLPVPRLTEDEHERIDPLSELAETRSTPTASSWSMVSNHDHPTLPAGPRWR